MKKLFGFAVLTAVLSVVFLSNISCQKKSNNVTPSTPSSERAASLVINDVLNRRVEIPANPNRIIVADHYLELFAVGGDKVFERIVGWSARPWVGWRNSIYKEFAAAVPRLKEITDVGFIYNDTFDVEKFLRLKPDVFILPEYQFKTLKKGIKELIDKSNIPIVIIDFSSGTSIRNNRSIEVLGEVLGRQSQAKRINNLYNSYIEKVQSRTSKLYSPLKTVYLESASLGPSKFGETWGSTNWAPIIDVAGGNNISKKIVKIFGNADNEFILTENPSYIFFTGSIWPSKKESIPLGFSISVDATKEAAQTYIDGRAGWSKLKAVRNKNVYMMHHGFVRSVLIFVPTVYIASVLYPDSFTDMNAEQILKDFYTEFLPVEYRGTWFAKLYE